MLYPQKGSMAKGSRRKFPTAPVAAAVVSDAVIEAARLEDERYDARAAASKEDRVDGHARRVLPLRCDGGVLAGGRREARVGVCCRGAEGLRPDLALPVDE